MNTTPQTLTQPKNHILTYSKIDFGFRTQFWVKNFNDNGPIGSTIRRKALKFTKEEAEKFAIYYSTKNLKLFAIEA